MKTISCFVLLISTSLFPLAIASAEDVQSIMTRIEQEKVAALTGYLEANPGAQDSETGLSYLIVAHAFLGNTKEITPLLEKRYAITDKGADAELSDLFGNVVQPLIEAYSESDNKEKALAFIEEVRTDTASHPMAQQIGQFLSQMGGGLDVPSTGDTLEIAFTDLDGKEIDLAAMKGKVVLVDFWATWCGPCVAEMPNVIAAYKKFHDKGFEIIGISLDSDKGTLVDFIKSKEMTWPQYFDGKGWENDIAGKYGIRSIPATFLVGKDGKIAAADLRGSALEGKLGELLK